MSKAYYRGPKALSKNNLNVVMQFFEGNTYDQLAKKHNICFGSVEQIVPGISQYMLELAGKPWQLPRITRKDLMDNKDTIMSEIRKYQTATAPTVFDESLKFDSYFWTDRYIRMTICVLNGENYTKVATDYNAHRTFVNSLVLNICRHVGQHLGITLYGKREMLENAKELKNVLTKIIGHVNGHYCTKEYIYSLLSKAVHENTEQPMPTNVDKGHSDDVADEDDADETFDEEDLITLRAIVKAEYKYTTVTPIDLYDNIYAVPSPECAEHMLHILANLGLCEKRGEFWSFAHDYGIYSCAKVIVECIDARHNVEIEDIEPEMIDETVCSEPCTRVDEPEVELNSNASAESVFVANTKNEISPFTDAQIEMLEYWHDKEPLIVPFLSALATRFGNSTELPLDSVLRVASNAGVSIQRYTVLEFFASLSTICATSSKREDLGTLLGETPVKKSMFRWSRKDGYNIPYTVNSVLKVLNS